jgi:hypothetical protein
VRQLREHHSPEPDHLSPSKSWESLSSIVSKCADPHGDVTTQFVIAQRLKTTEEDHVDPSDEGRKLLIRELFHERRQSRRDLQMAI